MKNLLLLICLLAFGTGRGQDLQNNYSPLRPGKVPKKVLKDIFVANEKIAVERKMASEVKRDFLIMVRASHKNFAELDTHRVMMYSDTLARFISGVVQDIMAANPMLATRRMYTFTLRDEDMNAANHGPALITINLGLLANAHTYEEFVFVACHELSHEYLQHFYTSVENISKAIHDKTYRKKVRRLKRQSYNTIKQSELLLAKTISGLRRNSRSQELEADSMGLIFYNNLNLDHVAGIKIMESFDSSEVPYLHKNIAFQPYFDPSKAFFDDSWTVIDTLDVNWMPDSSIWVLPDSLKTHPDCKVRLKKLRELSGSPEKKMRVDKPEFLYMRNIARFELLEEYLSNEDYANSLYFAMQLQQEFPENIYLKNVVLNSLIEMSNALKDHRFSQVVDHPNFFYYPGFNVMLHFLHHLNSSALRKMSIAYFNDHLQNVQNDAFTGYNAILMKSWDTAKEKKPDLIGIYKENFKDAFYCAELEKKFKRKNK